MNIKVDGVERQALVFPPSNPTGNKVPLVFAFHGHGGNMNGFSQHAALQNAWPEALVVYPQGLPIPTTVDPEGLKPGWQWEPGEVGNRDLKFVDAMLKTFRQKYPVDDRHVFAVGFSNGAFFTYLLWAERPQIFAAFALVAGRSNLAGRLTMPKPAVQIGGERDQLIRLNNLKTAMLAVRRLNGCSEQGEPCGPGCIRYPSSKNAPVINWIHPGPHIYPPNATSLIINFFKELAGAGSTTPKSASAHEFNEFAELGDGAGSEETDPSAKHIQSEAAKEFRKNAAGITFPSGELQLHGWIYKPEGTGPFPALVWNHGSEKNPGRHPELGMFYTKHGYALFLPVRRGHDGSPGVYIKDAIKDFAEHSNDRSLVQQKAIELQEQCNADVVAAVAWLKQQPFIDPNRIAVTGVSFGGIQTLLTAEKELGLRGAIPFAPGAMSWANPELQKREIAAARNAKAPLFLLQAQNDYSVGPSEALGPIIRDKGGLNRAKIYPSFGTTHADGHGGFACWEEGIALWGNDVLDFLKAAGMR